MHKKKDAASDGAKQGYFSTKSAKATEDLQWTKYKSKAGHGFAAEDANALRDQLKGKKVNKVGETNEKNGADRIVNGSSIQTKYYQTAQDSVNAAFDKETGLFRYKGQVLEVPKDQYEKAVEHMAEKIRQGKVPGTHDPKDAEKIIKKGDIKSQSVVAVHSFGISFALQYASCLWNGMGHKDALKLSVTSGFRTGSIVLGTGVLTQQLLRTSMGRGFAAFTSSISKRVVDHLYSTELGKKVIHKIATVMLGKNLAGAAAKNAVTKMLRTNVITSTVTTAVMSMPDFYKALVSKKISWKQFAKNLTVNATGVAGGLLGTYGGATIGGTVGAAIGTFIAPGVGTALGAKIGSAIGGFTGGLGLGMGASMGSKKLLDLLAEDDAQEMFRLAQDVIAELAEDYMVTEDEFETQIGSGISETITPKWLEQLYQAGQGEEDRESARKEYIYAACAYF